jgi:hypothetical protein
VGGARCGGPAIACEGVTTIVNELTVFMVVRAASHPAAAELVKDHPHITHFPCDAAEVMPVLG